MKKMIALSLLVSGWMLVGSMFASACEYYPPVCHRVIYRSYCAPVRTYCPPVRSYCAPVWYNDCDPFIDFGYGC